MWVVIIAELMNSGNHQEVEMHSLFFLEYAVELRIIALKREMCFHNPFMKTRLLKKTNFH